MFNDKPTYLIQFYYYILTNIPGIYSIDEMYCLRHGRGSSSLLFKAIECV